MRGDLSLAVVDLVASRQVDQLLREERLLIGRDDEIIDQDVVHERCAHRAWIAKVVDLNRGGTKRQDLRAGVLV